MRHTSTSVSLYVRLFSLMISYTLLVALIAPCAVRPVGAVEPIRPPAGEKATRSSMTSATATRQSGAQEQPPPARRDGELIVRFREGVSEAAKNDVVASKGGRRVKKLRGASRVEKVELQAGQDPAAVAAELRLHPEVEIAEPNYLIKRAQQEDGPTPNDAQFNEQWALRNTGQTGGEVGADVRAGAAWQTATGSTSTIIAIIDSGIDFTHPDLQRNQWTNGGERDNDQDDDRNGNNSRNALAYPTVVTDPDGYALSTQYSYDLGAVAGTQTPMPNTTQYTPGPMQTMEYDSVGRILRVTTQTNGAYTRWVYSASLDYVQTFTTVEAGAGESYTAEFYDGAGRVTANSAYHVGSAGGYRAAYFEYDVMGRMIKQSNPTEITGAGVPAGDDAAGKRWTWQAYDWQGRPTVTTNPDGSTTENTYGGCGCAGGDVTTVRDERGRRKHYTKDVLGRLLRVEELNWDQSVYATTNYTYNGRDQLVQINQAGQLRTFGYDGHGRLASRTTPEQGTTTYTYNWLCPKSPAQTQDAGRRQLCLCNISARSRLFGQSPYNSDDTTQAVTDARGASSTFSYNNRHLPTAISYGVPAGVAQTAPVSYTYDAVGNRTQMTDGQGSVVYNYDQLSRMQYEERTFTGLGTYRLTYGYNLAGELTSVTNP